jgi:hypothetical protein
MDDNEGADYEPNAKLAERAIARIIWHQTPLTIRAHNEILRIEALEEAAAAVVPVHVTMGRLTRNIDELEHKRANQAKTTCQTSEAITKAELWLAECTAVAVGIDQQIMSLEAKREQLMANMVSPDKRRQDTNESGMAALDLLLQSASGVIDVSTIQALRGQISNIAQQVQLALAPGIAPSHPSQAQPSPPSLVLLGGESDRPNEGNSTDWSNSKTELTSALQHSVQSRQQACASAALAAKALVEATAALEASPLGDGLAETVQLAAKLVEATDAAAKLAQEAEAKASEDLQTHKNTAYSAPYDRN